MVLFGKDSTVVPEDFAVYYDAKGGVVRWVRSWVQGELGWMRLAHHKGATCNSRNMQYQARSWRFMPMMKYFDQVLIRLNVLWGKR